MRLVDVDAFERSMSDLVQGDIRGYPDGTWYEFFGFLDNAPTVEVSVKDVCEKKRVWDERVVEDCNPLFRRRFYCPFCGSWQTYGKPKYCPDCGERVYE